MNAKEMKNIDRLDFEETKREPAFDLGYRRYRLYRDDNFDFQVGISGNGFEARRNLSLDGLVEIRNWIDEVVTASGRGDPKQIIDNARLASLKELRKHAAFDPEGDLSLEEFDRMMERADTAITATVAKGGE